MIKMNSKKNIIGITGRTCTGKSSISKYIQYNLSCDIIHLDKLCHSLLDENYIQISEIFTRDVIYNTNQVNRKILGDIVLRNRDKMLVLESFLKPLVIRKVTDTIQQSKHSTIFIDASVLVSYDLHLLCNKIILLYSESKELINRAIYKNMSSIKLNLILNNQFSTKFLLQYADFYIYNNTSLSFLYYQVKSILKFSNLY